MRSLATSCGASCGSVISKGAFDGGGSVLAVGKFVGVVVVCAAFSAIVFGTVASIAEVSVASGGSTKGKFVGVVVVCAAFSAIVFGTVASIAEVSVASSGSSKAT
jgi:uncharacterized protein YsxB (DUF464 family)